MGDTPILDEPWPDGLDPATVPFRTRSVAILRRAGFFDDRSLFNALAEGEGWSWWNAGVGTVADIRNTGNEAIVNPHAEVARWRQVDAGLAALTEEPWADHVWYHDRRFREYLPKTDATVFDTATSLEPPKTGASYGATSTLSWQP